MITQDEFDEFVKLYTWEVIRNADYRVGQAFVNYFTAISRAEDFSVDETTNLFYNTSNEECWAIIRKFVK